MQAELVKLCQRLLFQILFQIDCGNLLVTGLFRANNRELFASHLGLRIFLQADPVEQVATTDGADCRMGDCLAANGASQPNVRTLLLDILNHLFLRFILEILASEASIVG